MAFTPNWTTKVFTVPLGDLTFVSGVNYTIDADDFWIEIRRLEASAANNGGLYAEQALEFINTQVLSGLSYSAIVKLINGYTWEVASSNIIISLLGKNSNLLDTFTPANGVSVLANNSAGKIETGSGVTAGDVTDIENAIFNRIVETGFSFEELIRIQAAVAAGNVTQQADGSYVIRDINDTKDRVTGDDSANSGRDISAVDGT